ncbi:rhodanese-like domain-containing protein [Brumimicrobium glaciale]|uniref:Rhodanese-like domain-containing protein n=1 Tax=Brumimicrobium glaciale TaxID=200475 RepID=A0A4Q4KTK5_9FLAO|nr:rhodanese-like domain-containing protein [Brumimicrobium glaciale]RYM35434.1 rhodanese-like domain-containing protein [Brumimicrobium glaciale]
MKTTLTILIALLFASTQVLFAQNTPEERFESVGNAEFKKALETGEYILLDTRTVEEYDVEHIEGSKLVEYNGGDMDDVLTLMPRDQKYLVYCAIGVRSKVAMERMKELGFHYVLELDKGIKEWK